MTRQTERSPQELPIDDHEPLEPGGVSRRGFLSSVSLVGLGAAVAPLSSNLSGSIIPEAMAQGAPASGATAQPSGPQPLDYPGKEKGLVVLGERPLVAETPEHLLDDETTPISKFFIRNNGQIPEPTASPDAWKLTVDGTTALDGDLPVNPSGGVMSTNPIGASGMIRFAEAAMQVRGTAGAHQVEGAKTALGHAYGGGSQYFAMWIVSAEKP